MSSSPPITVSYTSLLSSVTISGFSNSIPLPQMCVAMSAMSTWYSPSDGRSTLARMPPRVPSGRPGTCVSCAPGPARNVHPPGRASGRPTAFTATARAAITYCSMNDGDTCRAVAMLSNPSAASSAGRTSVASKSTASRSRTAFAYSLRLSRCSTTSSRTCFWPAA